MYLLDCNEYLLLFKNKIIKSFEIIMKQIKFELSLKIIYIIIFIILFIVSSFLIIYHKNNTIDELLSNKTNYMYQKYNALQNNYYEVAEIVANIIGSKILNNNQMQENSYDDIVLDNLNPLLKKYNINNVVFYDINNKRQKTFFNNKIPIENQRDNYKIYINNVHKNQKNSEVFIIGINEYCYFYPIFKDNKYLGCAVISFDMLDFIYDFTKNYKVAVELLINKNSFDPTQSLRDKIKINDNFVLLDNMPQKFSHSFTESTLKSIIDGFYEQKSIFDENLNSIITFIPIHNQLLHKIEALFIIKSEDSYISHTFWQCCMYIFLLNSFSLIIFVFFYRNHKNHIKLNTIIQEADSGIGLIDLSGKFQKVNKAYAKLLGYDQKALLEKNCYDLTIPDDRIKARDFISNAIQLGNVSKVRKRCFTKNGEILNLDISLKLLPSKNHLLVVINSVEDKIRLEKLNDNLQAQVEKGIEEIRNKERLLAKQSKMAALGEMIDAIAHQWKTPLAVTKLYSQQIEYEIENNDYSVDEIKDFFQRQYSQIDHLVETIDEFRSFFRPGLDKAEKVKIYTLVESVQKLMKDELIKNQINLEVIGDKEIEFFVIPNEFKHILINLISNARDAFNSNHIKTRNITITIEKTEQYNILEVIDNGGGIPQSILNKIFNPHFTTKGDSEGTGIGLYLTKQIVEKLDGSIEVKNIPNGACFTLKIAHCSKINAA